MSDNLLFPFPIEDLFVGLSLVSKIVLYPILYPSYNYVTCDMSEDLTLCQGCVEKYLYSSFKTIFLNPEFNTNTVESSDGQEMIQ